MFICLQMNGRFSCALNLRLDEECRGIVNFSYLQGILNSHIYEMK